MDIVAANHPPRKDPGARQTGSDTRVTLRPITRDNWQESIRLSVRNDQREYVASNLYSLAEAHFHATFEALAIYDSDTMVGFTMYGQDEATGAWWIIRLMVDARYQGRGYGRAAMLALIDRLVAQTGCAEIWISFAPGNTDAARLYTRLGFQETGLIEDGEVVYRLSLESAHPEPRGEAPVQ